MADGDVTRVHASPARLVWRRFAARRVALVALAVFVVIAVVILLAPWTARYGEIERLADIYGKNVYAPPSRHAWFGTDELNRDVYSRIIWGGRVSLFVGLAVAVVSTAIGVVVGAIAGYRGGLVDDVMMRVTDLFLAFPVLVLLLVLRNMFDRIGWLDWLFGDPRSIRFMVVLLALLGWMGVARIMRGVVMSLKQREFVEAAIAQGASATRVVVRHLLPNAIGPIIVAMTTAVVGAIVAESTLSFFGYGIDPVYRTSWGNLLASSQSAVLGDRPWLVVFPAGVFVLTVLSITFVGDALRDALDPRQALVRPKRRLWASR